MLIPVTVLDSRGVRFAALVAHRPASCKNMIFLLFEPFRPRLEVPKYLSAVFGDQWSPKTCLGHISATVIRRSGATW